MQQANGQHTQIVRYDTTTPVHHFESFEVHSTTCKTSIHVLATMHRTIGKSGSCRPLLHARLGEGGGDETTEDRTVHCHA